MLGGVRRYHEKLSLTVDSMPVAIPVSLRTDADPMGANKFAGARFVAPVGEPDPKARIVAIHRFITDVRIEPALWISRPSRTGAESPPRDSAHPGSPVG